MMDVVCGDIPFIDTLLFVNVTHGVRRLYLHCSEAIFIAHDRICADMLPH